MKRKNNKKEKKPEFIYIDSKELSEEFYQLALYLGTEVISEFLSKGNRLEELVKEIKSVKG